MAATIIPTGEIALTFGDAKGRKVRVLMDRETALRHVEQVVECLERLRHAAGRDAEIEAFTRALRV